MGVSLSVTREFSGVPKENCNAIDMILNENMYIYIYSRKIFLRICVYSFCVALVSIKAERERQRELQVFNDVATLG